MLRVIHPNRWFFWTIVLLFIVGLGLLFYLSETNQELEEHSADLAWETNENLSSETYSGWRSFRQNDLGFTLKYPADWQIEVDQNQLDTFYLQDSENFNQNLTLSVVSEAAVKEIRGLIEIRSETDMVIDGYEAVWLENADEEDLFLKYLVFIEKGDSFVFVSGQASEFEKIVKSIKFLSE